MSDRTRRAEATLREVAEDAGVHVSIQARLLLPYDAPSEGAATVDVASDEETPIASLYKIPLAACWADTVGHSPTARIHLADPGRTPGTTGLAALADPVEVSQRDAVRLMLSLSDNACAEAILDLVGLTQLATWVDHHHLTGTRIRRGSAEGLRRIIEETGSDSLSQALAWLADPRADRDTSEYDSALASSSTAADLNGMLALLWREPRYAWVRDSMALQPWRHRVAAGFPHDDVTIAGKTGTLGRLRHEAAVVQFPYEFPVAVTVLTRSIRPENQQPRADAAVGVMARLAVNALRRQAVLSSP